VSPRDPLWPTAADWLGQNNAAAPPPETELAVIGVPLSVTSITQPAGAHETPEAVRRRLAVLSTYHSERDVDVGELSVVDFGDLVAQPSNKEIASAARDVVREAPMAVLLGGDNAVTYPAMLGMAGEGIEGWGLVTLDAHHDVRTFEGRPGNGSPVRALIEAGLRGNQIVHFGTIEDVLVEAFDRLALSVDHIYVDLDVDVLDPAFAPACPGARPGGLFPGELLAAAFLAGRNPRVRAVDIVEVDATRDVHDRTVDVAALCLLNAAAGLHERLR
jgi:formiminoglutamase